MVFLSRAVVLSVCLGSEVEVFRHSAVLRRRMTRAEVNTTNDTMAREAWKVKTKPSAAVLCVLKAKPSKVLFFVGYQFQSK
ncbi:neuropeptides capa receptor [Biomphalaria pfeifferi]|uniref:Neuropeptides capa receptor n=1 Tax=Biomphalaria pfeifferi TaxID=112525 RepID=A0AAD8BMK4_BIOPF|nr:neuropeptides capa receptor [Biomphalaria pfeifferi]